MPRRPAGVLAATALTVAGLVAPALSARAADLGSLTLDSKHSVVTWSGQSTLAAGYGPPACAAQTPQVCDVLKLDVELPAGTFGPGDGVLVSIKWATDYDQYNLFVDNPDGTPAASGIDVDSNGQSVLLTAPQNGVYTVRVVPFYTTFPQDLTYQGEARVWHDPTAHTPAGTELLPQLETVAPSGFHVADIPPIQSNPTGWRWTPDGTFTNSCYLDETTTYGSTRCLRFDNDIRNVGPGPLKLRFRWDTNVVSNCVMEQEIDVLGGSPIDRNAGPCVFHAQHAHFHYQNMAWYQLFAVDAQGRPADVPVSKSYKLGFCAIDVDDYGFGTTAARKRTYSFPTCNVPNTIPAASDPAVWEYMGISPGWGDIYTWDLPGQYIDVSNVPDGTYELVSRANPDGGLLESATGLETGVTCIHMSGSTVTVVQSYASQSNSAPLPTCSGAGHGVQPAATVRDTVPASQSSATPASIATLPDTSLASPAAATGLLVAPVAVALRIRRRHRQPAPPRDTA